MTNKTFTSTSEQMATASLVMAAMAFSEVPCMSNAASAANASARAYVDMKVKEMMTSAGIEAACMEALREQNKQWRPEI